MPPFTNRLDGVVIDDVTTQKLPEGFHVVSFCPTGDMTAASIGMGTQRWHGGNQYGEVILYTNALSKTEHDKVEAELMAKWLGQALPGGDAPATLDKLTIGGVFKDGVVTGSLGFADKRSYSVVKKSDGNLYLRISARGMIVIVK